MPTYLSDVLTNKAASPPVMAEFNRVGGRVKLSYATYTMGSDTTEVATDVVQMVEVPKGSIVWPQMCYIWWTDCGGTITVDVGNGTDDDLYCSALAMETASTALADFAEASTATVAAWAGEYTAPDTIDLTFDTVTTPNATGVIYMCVAYTQNG